MQPFSIICQSCAAKLKVTQESAIGQMLACPKCGNMLRVAAPDGYVPTPKAPESTSQFSGSQFEDIDSLLGGSPAPPTTEPPTKPAPNAPTPERLLKKRAEERRPSAIVPSPKTEANPKRDNGAGGKKKTAKNSKAKAATVKTSTQPSKANKPGARPNTTSKVETRSNIKAGSSAKASITTRTQQKTNDSASVKAKHAAEQATSDSPLLPNEQWTSDETKARKRMTRIIAMAVAGLMLTMLLCYALIQFLGQTPEPVVSNTGDDVIVSPDENADSATSSDPTNPINDDSSVNPQIDQTADPTTGNEVTEINTDVDDAPPAIDMGDAATDLATAPPIDMTDAPPIDMSDTPPQIENNSSVPVDGLNGESTTPNPGQTPATSSTTGLEKDNTLGKLTKLLQKSGKSILEIQDLAAAERDRFGVGQPRYFIEPADHDPVNRERQEVMEIAGVQYKEVTLRQTLSELTALSGLTFSIDSIAAMQNKVTPNPKLDLMLEGKTLTEIADAVAKAASMTVQKVETGFILTVPRDSELIETIYDVSPLVDTEKFPIDNLSKIVQGFVEAKSWPVDNAKGDQPSIVVENQQLKITQTKWAHRLVSQLLEAMTEIKKSNEGALGGNELFSSRLTTKQGPLAKTPGLKLTPRKKLSQLFEEIEANTGVAVLANWNELAELGWSTDSMAPGRIDEPTTNDVIRQIAHSMGLTVYVADSKTVILTTFEDAATYFDLRVYSIRKLTEKEISSNELERLITEAMGAQLGAPGVKLLVVESCNSLIAIAPQSLHRQIETVLGQFSE